MVERRRNEQDENADDKIVFATGKPALTHP